jgi:hypothetical protein
MARDSRLRIGRWVPDRDNLGHGVPLDGDAWADPEGGALAPHGGEVLDPDERYDPDATEVVSTERLIDLGTDPGRGWPSDDTGTGELQPYRGRRRHHRRRQRGHLVAAAAMVAAVVIGTFTVVQLASSDPVTLGPPPGPEPSRVITTSTPGVARLGDAPTPTPSPTPTGGPSPIGGAGEPTGRPGRDPTGPSTAPPAGGGASYEAEHAASRRGATTDPMAAASGGQVVRLSPNASVDFSGVVADRDGPYELTVYYAGTSDYTARLSVNGGSAVTVEFPGLREGAIGAVAFQVDLVAGENTITVGQPNEPGLLLDRIVVTD